ncbi:MAG: hypothetical protein KC431_28845, partial [Myxococcales bacterium]|nr:hypothetical protein [Myxococcales bacterium]
MRGGLGTKLREHWSLVLAGVAILALVGLSWWSLTSSAQPMQPERVLVIVELEGSGGLQWGEGDAGAALLTTKLERELGELG